ncbi:MAG: 16S rRNA (cytosine(1402)-N(4))-methyltransferase RsmH [Tahibacter sp.]
MKQETLKHIPVMLEQAVDALAVKDDGTYLDGTFGRGGHAREILQRLGPRGRLLLMDRDPLAIAVALEEFAQDDRVRVRHESFATLAQWSETEDGLDGVLLDLGMSSPQLDDPQRGFSFQGDAPLDMRMDTTRGESAAQFLARADETQIADVLFQFGEERMSRRIARLIVERRATDPIHSTAQLADLVARAIGRREPGKHPATRTFQALRIAVNGELDALTQGLASARKCLRERGRLAVISFHSLEDRIVKQFIREHSQAPPTRRGLPPPPDVNLTLRPIGAAQFPDSSELARNPRSRSAVLRTAERLAPGVSA